MGLEMMENGGEQDKQEMSHVVRHFCRVCNKGFDCAGALGGHMRAHVINMGDVSNSSNNNSNNHTPLHGDEKPEANNKHSYFLRAKTTSRFMGYNLSENIEDGEYLRKSSLLSSPSGSKSQHFDNHEYYSTSSEEEDLANCLVMLSNNNKSCNNNNSNKEENKAKEVVEKGMFQCKACKKVFNSHQALGGHRASHKKVKGCFAAKLDIIGLNDELDEDSIQEDHHHHHHPHEPVGPTTEPISTTSNARKVRPKMHECSVCRRVFSSGQALGGHKRCHWLTTSTDNAFIPNFHDFQYDHHQKQQQSQQLYKKPMLTKPHHHDHLDHDHDLDLNLNLPANAGDNMHNTSRYEEASTRLYLQQLANHNQQNIETENGGQKGSCEMKLTKLSDLRDVNLDGAWLQVGIASTTDIY